MLHSVLLAERLRVLESRATRPEDVDAHAYNQRTRALMRIFEEVQSLMDEKGWPA